MPPLIYLILVHKAPAQLERLVQRLKNANSHIYIHVDARVDQSLFLGIEDEQVCFIEERYASSWGDFNITRAILALIRQALSRHPSGTCILLSGNDYPIKHSSHIHDFFNRHSDQNFIDINDAAKMWRLFRYRRDFYKVNLSEQTGKYVLLKGLGLRTWYYFARGFLSSDQFKRIAFTRKRLTPPLHFYGGSTWWAINIPTLQKVVAYIEEHEKSLYSFFSTSLLPDEFFFQTILMHFKETHKNVKLKDTVTYVNWTCRKLDFWSIITRKTNLWDTLINYSHPKIFTKHHLQELIQQPTDKLFARKFDLEVDSEVLDLLDAHLT